ncbi:MAG: glycosyltransferase family 2 protein [Thermoflexibacter sp.]
MQTKVAVVILNYNGKKYLAQFLPSVIAYTQEAKIIVADNGSTDDSLVFLSEQYPDIEVISMKQNTGFSTGYNLALRQVSAEYYVLLNSDIEVSPHWLTPLLRLMEGNPQIAACQPKIKAFHAKHQFEHAGAGGGFIDIFGFPFCRGRILDLTEKDLGQYDDNKEVFWTSGACMLIRANLYHELGGLDDDFFAHMEEIDLCWRLKNAGHQLFYCGESEVFHVGGGTLSYQSPKKLYLNFRNSLVMLVKNTPFPAVLWLTFLRMVIDGVGGIWFLFKGNWRNFYVVLQSHFYFYRHFFSILQKRKKARNIAKIDAHPQIFKGSIVWEYFIKKKKKFSEIINSQ